MSVFARIGNLFKSRDKYSLEQLHHYHNVLVKHSIIDDENTELVVETLRAVAELLIWGDQHSPAFFDFFLEKNMLLFFLSILNQKTGSSVKVQLLQTISILIENISNETSIYYLLSNNHVNDLIVYKYDFSNEELLAYYISFLKTLSLKLNPSTIQFFFNETTRDFPLYTEAVKFFNHPEPMIRIAVRTLTLNVYRIPNDDIRDFVLDRTAVPYLPNLVNVIGSQCAEIDKAVAGASHLNRARIDVMVNGVLDLLYYINDIFCLEIDELSAFLTSCLMQELVIPFFVASIVKRDVDFGEEPGPLSPLSALFFISQVLVIFQHQPLINGLATWLIHPNPPPVVFLPTSAPSPPVAVDASEAYVYPPVGEAPEASAIDAGPTGRKRVRKRVRRRRRSSRRTEDKPGGLFGDDFDAGVGGSGAVGGEETVDETTLYDSDGGATYDTPTAEMIEAQAALAATPVSTPEDETEGTPEDATGGSPDGSDGDGGGGGASLHSATPPQDDAEDGGSGGSGGDDGPSRARCSASSDGGDGDIFDRSYSEDGDLDDTGAAVRNPYRKAIEEYLDVAGSDVNDQIALLSVCVLSAIVKNPATSKDLLAVADMLPQHGRKVKRLLEVLTSGDDDMPTLTGPSRSRVGSGGSGGSGGGNRLSMSGGSSLAREVPRDRASTSDPLGALAGAGPLARAENENQYVTPDGYVAYSPALARRRPVPDPPSGDSDGPMPAPSVATDYGALGDSDDTSDIDSDIPDDVSFSNSLVGSPPVDDPRLPLPEAEAAPGLPDLGDSAGDAGGDAVVASAATDHDDDGSAGDGDGEGGDDGGDGGGGGDEAGPIVKSPSADSQPFYTFSDTNTATGSTAAGDGSSGPVWEYSFELATELISVLLTPARCRMTTLLLTIQLLRDLVVVEGTRRRQQLSDDHLQMLLRARAMARYQVIPHFSEAKAELFTALYEDEHRKLKPPKLEFVVGDSSLLLPLSFTPLSGLDLDKRLPSGDLEQMRRTIQVFIAYHQFAQLCRRAVDDSLPWGATETVVYGTSVDLADKDLMEVTRKKDDRVFRRYLVVEKGLRDGRLMLVEPDTEHTSHGLVRFVQSLQNITIRNESPVELLVSGYRNPGSSARHLQSEPLWVLDLVFDDTMRCRTAREHIQSGCRQYMAARIDALKGLLEIAD